MLFRDQEDGKDIVHSKQKESSEDVVELYNLDTYDDSDINSSDDGSKIGSEIYKCT